MDWQLPEAEVGGGGGKMGESGQKVQTSCYKIMGINVQHCDYS